MVPPDDNEHGCAWRDYALELKTELADAKTELKTVKGAVDDLAAQLEVLKRSLFAKKSEKQKKMPPIPKPPVTADASKAKRDERAAARDAAMETVVETTCVPESDKVCTLCGGTDFRAVGAGKTCDVYEFVAAHFRRRRFVRETVACRCGGCVITAPPPPRWSENTRYASSFVAYLAVSKCRGSLPFYRMEGLAKYSDMPLARSTMNDLFHRAGAKLLRLQDPLFNVIRSDFIVLADETTFKLTSQKSKAFMWTFLGATLTGYRFALTRGGDVPVDVLKTSEGMLVCDDYSGYDPLIAKGHRIRCGCVAHARRKWFDAGDVPDAHDALALIGVLYAVEHEAIRCNVVGTPEHAALRQTFSRPAFCAFIKLARRVRRSHAPKTLLGRAARYACRNVRELGRFLGDVRIPLDNNRAENAMRPVALGRANFMFVQSEDSGKSLAILYSLVISAERCGVNPVAYLTDVLDRIDHVADDDLRDLLPDRWKPPPKPTNPVDFESA